MEELHKARPVREFARPEGLVEETVCGDNGLLSVSGVKYQVSSVKYQMSGDDRSALETIQYPVPCSHTITELFIEGTEPKQIDDWHQRIALDRRNGLRAGSGCPLDFVTFQTFTLYPAEALAWARNQGVPEPPDVYSPFCPGQTDNEFVDNNGITDQLHPSSFIPHPLIFTSPDQGSVFRLSPTIPADKQKIRVSVRPVDGVTVEQVSLLINGQLLAEGSETLWQMTPGVYTFEAVGIDREGNEINANSVTIEVVE